MHACTIASCIIYSLIVTIVIHVTVNRPFIKIYIIVLSIYIYYMLETIRLSMFNLNIAHITLYYMNYNNVQRNQPRL